ncbi:MAG: hypothetical protein ACI9H8_001588 [Lysobacterales bacterium]|jgi:hypothetical protein
MKLTIGVTGHRDLVENELPVLRDQVRAFFNGLDKEFPDLELQLISPLAEGGDQLVAEIAVELGHKLIVPLPMPQTEYEKDFTTEEYLQKFRTLIANAQIINLPLAGNESEATIAHSEKARELQYTQLGIFISNHCQVLLALWDGKPGPAVGGTAGVVNYHLTAVMPGYSISEESPNLLADNENDLAYHIVVSRDREDGGVAEGMNVLETYWMSAHFERREALRMPEEFHSMLLRLQEFNADLKKYKDQISSDSSSLLNDVPDVQPPGGSELVNHLFSCSDWLAIHFQKRFNQGMIITHALAVVMGLIFIIYAEYGGPEFLAHAFLGLFLFGVAFHRLGAHRQWHRKYLDYRALAEGLRVQLYWNLAGVIETRSAVFAYDNFLQKQDVDLGWIRHVMRSASLQRDRILEPDDRWVNWVSEQWVGSQDHGHGQLGYYHRKSNIKAVNYRRTTRLGSISLWLGIFIAAILAWASGWITMDQRHFLLVLMGILPLIAGVRDAYSHKKAERELIKQYRFMNRVFTNARRLLDSTPDLHFRRRVLMAVGNAALEEHAEWILMHRERPLEQGGL